LSRLGYRTALLKRGRLMYPERPGQGGERRLPKM